MERGGADRRSWTEGWPSNASSSLDLQDLPLLMKGERLEVGLGEDAPVSLLHADGHGRTEHRQSLVEADDLLLVQPQQDAVRQLGGVPDLALQDQVGLDRPRFLAAAMLSRVRSEMSRRSKCAMEPKTWNTSSPAADEVSRRSPGRA